ncbi:General secretion pathway protein F [hydrothermal vent metagenome]|uniref:General secretion pathway protein F n=1 Tax=hydrothermal vent metagenome TaxID=652676 RepID=A0A3B0XYF0_9ZZZZ
MSAYEYTVLDQKGREKTGVLEGDTPKQVRQQLRDKGLTPLTIQPVASAVPGKANNRQSRRGISALDLALITRQLGALLKAGLPLEEALRSVSQQSDKARIEKVLMAVRAKVREGHSFASGLLEFPNIFPEIYQKTVAAGETSGHLDLVLERLADYTENRHKIKQRTSLALFYPALLTVVAVSVVSALLAFIVPKVIKIFDNVDQQLPVMTRALIIVSDFIRDYWIAIFVVIIASIMTFKFMMQQTPFKMAWHRLILSLPMIGKMTRTANAARFSRTLSILNASNVPILDALDISGEVLSSLPMRKAVSDAALKVREGTSLNIALQASHYFPPMTLSLIASGEASGNLDEMLERAAEIQEREMESVIATLLGMFEPILILIMGAVIMVIVLALLLPIFELNSIVGR